MLIELTPRIPPFRKRNEGIEGGGGGDWEGGETEGEGHDPNVPLYALSEIHHLI